MDRAIEIAFRVPYRLLREVESSALEKGRFGLALKHSTEELMSLLDKANSAIAKAEEDLTIQMKNGDVSKDLIKQFMFEKVEYSIKAEDVKNIVLSRTSPLLAVLSSS